MVESPVADSGFHAQVTGFESVTEKEIIAYITRSGSTVTVAEAKANYEELIGAYEYFLGQGYGINTEFINIRPTITGVFRDMDDKFDPSRHQVRFRPRLGRRNQKTSDDVKVERIEANAGLPLPVTLEDIVSDTINSMLSPGSVVSLSGKRLLFRQDDLQQGIFLTGASGSSKRVEKILSQKGTQVIFIAPGGLPSGSYSLEVRTITGKSKTIKTGTLPDKLTIQI